MDSFSAALLRLKQQVGVHHDKEVAELLGMTDKALNARKARGAFPEDKLFALASRRPDLQIDPNYVLHGTGAKKRIAEKAASWMAAFPARVREVRGDRTPQAFAALLGISTDKLAEIESGRRKPTSEELRCYIDSHPEHSPTWLIGGEPLELDEPLTDLEVILIRNYRVASAEGQESVRRQAAFFREYASRAKAKKP